MTFDMLSLGTLLRPAMTLTVLMLMLWIVIAVACHLMPEEGRSLSLYDSAYGIVGPERK